ncbi:spermidine/putrescine transport system ATP-binding protein [Lachnospiraceae bacterium C10]|jgi:spermidine/putrescine transport system ATP-binding protein|nr:spermidine/putrescine transport system ATP-binding protein [Lachnospiraceae bacterium C10]
MNQNIIELSHITKTFEDGVTVIEDLNLSVKKGELVTLLGPSGCGKTTLLRMIGGFDMPTSGEILLHGQDIASLPPEKRPINTVFQKYALFPFLNIYDNIAFGLKQKKLEKDVIRQKVKSVLEMVDLEGFEKRRVDSLSGGQQQRVAVARAIVNEPELLLLDEPLSALDYKMRQEMQIEIKEMHRKLGMTFIYVTHDQEEAMNLSDRIVVMANGVIQQEGTPEEIYRRPNNIFVADFIGVSNIYNGVITKEGAAKFCGREWQIKPDLPVGRRMNAMIRPESVVISASADDGSIAVERTGIDGTTTDVTGETQAGIKAVVNESLFKGSVYEITAESGPFEITGYSPRGYEHGEEIGISFPEEAIHLMPYDTTMNLYEGTIVDETTADFGAFTLAIDLKNLYEGSHLDASGHLVNAEQKPIDWNGQRVSLNFNPADGDLSDDENAGFVCGNIDTIIYVGDHYMYIVRGDQDEEYYVDDEWLWNAGDRVSIVVPGDKLKLQLL